jgi:Domain of unknown function (DUF3821)
MKLLYILPVFIVIFLFISPVAGSLNKIAYGAPVFIGESDVDISSALNGCHTIAWWPEGTDTSTAPVGKNLTVSEINTVSPRIFHFNFTPDIFTGYTGTWYCQDKQPVLPVFTIQQPMINISILNLDNNADVTGQSLPYLSNITYRIDTNTYPAFKYSNRPNYNPSDVFYTVTMTDPRGRVVSNIYTGSAGNPKTVILSFDSHPLITGSSFVDPNMASWDQTARNIQGDVVYPLGTYTIAATQNLNNMQQAYAASGSGDTTGIISKSASFTLYREATPTPTLTPTFSVTTVAVTLQPSTITATTAMPTVTKTPTRKTTYSPLPVWILMVSIIVAGIFAIRLIRQQ